MATLGVSLDGIKIRGDYQGEPTMRLEVEGCVPKLQIGEKLKVSYSLMAKDVINHAFP
jgi:hypothetical protein